MAATLAQPLSTTSAAVDRGRFRGPRLPVMTRSARVSTSSSRPVARLTSPGEIVGAIPLLCGFRPRESLVVVSLRGDRSRIGLTMRFDLPPDDVEEAIAAEAVARLQADGARRTVVVVYTEAADAGGELARGSLVTLLRERCREHGVEVDDVLLVRGERWLSYLCRDPRCCPVTGTPLAEAAGSASLGLVAAEQAAEGRAVLASREQLGASIAPPELLAAARATQALAAADLAHSADQLERGRQAVISAAVDRFRVALERYAEPPGGLDAEEAATLAIALHDVLVRDEVATWALHDRDALLSLLTDLARHTVAPYDAPVCTLLAWVAYAEGNGGLANVALERVFASTSDYSMANLLRTALDAQIPPGEVRRVLRGTRRELRRRGRR
jgi:hypothetical protein